MSAAYLRVSARSSACLASLVSNVLASLGNSDEVVTELGGHVSDHRQRLRRAARPAPAARVIGGRPAPICACPTSCAADAGSASAASSSAPDSAERAVWAASRSASSSDNRLMSATSASSSPGRGSTASISSEPELQPVGLLRHFPCPLGPLGEITSSRKPRVAHRAVPLQLRTDVGEPIQRGALLVAAHQAQLVVLPVQGEQFGGEACSATWPARCGRRGRRGTVRRG